MQMSGGEPEDRLYLVGSEFVFDPDAGIYLPDNYQHEEGRKQYRNDDYEQDPKPHTMQYQITDHLGNLAVLFSDANDDGHVTSENETSDPDEIEVLQRHFYYPFGMDMDGTWLKVEPYEDLYRYNHKELTKGLGWYAYGARYYDAAIGRFTGVDPKAADAPGWSPYRAFFCNPIRYTDPDGQWEWDATGNLKAQKGDNSYSMAKFLGTNQSNAMQMLNRGGVTANAKGVLNLKEGQSFAQGSLWVGTKSASGPVVNNTKEATSLYLNGSGQAADVGDQSTRELLSSSKFQTKHQKITSENVDPNGYFSVDMTKSTFHIGNTGVDYSVTNNGNTSAVKYTLFTNTDKNSPNKSDGFWDADFIDEWSGMQKADELGPNLERFGGTPYPYKTRERTFFFKPVEEKK